MTPEDPASAHHRDLENAVWVALISDPAVGVTIVDEHGVILTANHRSAQLSLQSEPKDLIGKSIYELFPKDWADERMGVLKNLVETGRPVIYRHIRRGRQLQNTARPLETPEGKPRRVLILTHEGEFDPTADPDAFDVVESKIADFGPLDILTRRELEVLALIKIGLSTADIAKMLFRAPSTIEDHRSSLGKKLGVSSRIQLAHIAEQAGLEVKDAELQRTREP